MPTKLIEVALPLDAINREAAREKSIRKGHPSTLHLWWARRPLAACRAVLFGQLVDDPSAHPELFSTQASQAQERQRLFGIMERLVPWEASTDERVLGEARAEIARCYPDGVPPILDPFCGGGSIPLEAQRLGLEARASDLNPVAVLINKAMLELPPRWAGQAPVHPKDAGQLDTSGSWPRASGMADDVTWYATWMRDRAKERIGALYPSVLRGESATVMAWIWARTVTCPNPGCRSVAPLLNSYALSRRTGREAWLAPHADRDTREVRFVVQTGKGCPDGGTVSRTGAICLGCAQPMPLAYVRAEGKAGRMGTQLMCTVAEGARRKVYLDVDRQQLEAAHVARPHDLPETDLPDRALGFRVQGYGISKHWQLFSDRQLVAMTTFCDLVSEARKLLVEHGASSDYADAVATYLSLGIGRLANRSSAQCFWDPGGEGVMQVFARNALPMVWVFAEANPFSDSSGNFLGQIGYLTQALRRLPAKGSAAVRQTDAAALTSEARVVVTTDPPYYDNVPYADLSDFFYVWLRRCAGPIWPSLFSTMLAPKTEELIAEPNRHGSWEEAARFFEDGLRNVFERCRAIQVEGTPFAVFYAFKQSGEGGNDGVVAHASTGWETMLQGLVDAGCAVTGTWPMRTEQPGGLRELGRSALASSIVLVCRPRSATAGITDRRSFRQHLRRRLDHTLRDLQSGGVAPVDLAQAAIGPGMGVFSGYVKVVEPDGSTMKIRSALNLINQVLDEAQSEQEGEVDEQTRWAVAWFSEFGLGPAPAGKADDLARAKNVAVDGLVKAGIIRITVGATRRVQLVPRDGLDPKWDPATGDHLTVWEVTQQLIQRLMTGGEASAADLLSRVDGLGHASRDLSYRLYEIAKKHRWAQEEAAYNGLAASWLEISRIASAGAQGSQTSFAGLTSDAR